MRIHLSFGNKCGTCRRVFRNLCRVFFYWEEPYVSNFGQKSWLLICQAYRFRCFYWYPRQNLGRTLTAGL